MSEEEKIDNGVSGEHRLVHLDLKGAPPKISYYEWLFPMLHKWGGTGLLIEYEDMFPFSSHISDISASHAYSADEIQKILSLAQMNHLIVIPLIQTFGHFEYVLKQDKFRHLREVEDSPMALCPAIEESFSVLTEMIDQVLALHPNATHLHIGADEVFHIGMCARCLERIEKEKVTKLDLFLSHIKRVLDYLSTRHSSIQPIMWDDMLRGVDSAILKNSGIGELVEPMVWYYQPKFDGLPDVWPSYSEVFDSVWVASAYKGATGPCMLVTDINYHIENHKSWLNVAQHRVKPAFKHFRGYALTGWQRYDHYAVLCELLPVGLPSLAICLLTVSSGAFTIDVHSIVSEDLKFSELIPMYPMVGLSCDVNMTCDFYGCAIYRGVIDLVMMRADYKQLLRSERMKGWMARWHVKQNYSNPVHINHFLPDLKHLRECVERLSVGLRKALQDVYYPITVDEWMCVNVEPMLDKLIKLTNTAQEQAMLGGRAITYPQSSH